MTSFICRLCFNAVHQQEVQFINDTVKEMLQTLLIKVDLTVSGNPVICSNCHRKATENCWLKNKYLAIEKLITPFVTENVKVNLNEIRNEIIKSEMTENDKNVCRLCLEYIDNEMTLNEIEKVQFAKCFPEINLNLTHFTVLCSTCYDTLQKYFIFVISCSQLEEQQYGFSMAYNKEQTNSIKFEYPQEFDKYDEKVSLNDELDIKCETDDENVELPDAANSTSDVGMHSYTKYNCKTKKEGIKSNILNKHTDVVRKTFKCDFCGKDFKARKTLKLHILRKHTDLSTIPMYKCGQCNYMTKILRDLQNHTRCQHTDSSKIFKCEECDYQSKFYDSLKTHILRKHTDLSQLEMFKCEFCSYQSKIKRNLNNHIFRKHNPSKLQTRKCKFCDYESKIKDSLKNHIIYNHTDLSQITVYECQSCDYITKIHRSLRLHTLRKHVDSSQLQIYKCKICDYKCKIEDDLKQHTRYKHADLSKLCECEFCGRKFKKVYLQRHIRMKHSEEY